MINIDKLFNIYIFFRSEHRSRVVRTYVSVCEVTSSISWVANEIFSGGWRQVSGVKLSLNYQITQPFW